MIKVILFFLFLFPVVLYPSQRYEVIEQVNVRRDSTVLSDSFGFLEKAETCEVLEEKFDWYKIVLPQRFSCYVWAELFKEISPKKGRVEASVLNFRDKPALDANIIGKAKKGEVFTIVKKINGWFQIEGYPRLHGWVHRKFMKKIDSDNDKEVADAQQKLEEESLAFLLSGLANPSMAQKEPLHQQVIDMGSSIVPKLEAYLPAADINSKYSIIYILGQIGKENCELALDFLMKVDSISDVGMAAIFLDVVQDIVQPQGLKVPYFHLVGEGRLTLDAIKEARNYLHQEYNKQALFLQQELLVLEEEQ
ncbi:MAG: SH3 domain-containing protein [Candidatus Omnitrophota bacterium]|nr:MAG: SH3 domain-containing protein [Candidatus Omnitrophota bacterium]